MDDKEFQPKIRAPRLMRGKGESLKSSAPSDESLTPLRHEPTREASLSDSEEIREAQDGVESDSVPAKKDADGESMVARTYVSSSREGDNDIFPGIGKPKLLSGAVKTKLRPRPSVVGMHDIQANNSDENQQHNVSFGLLPFLGCACGLIAVLWMLSVSSPFLANALTLHGWRLWCSLAIALLPMMFACGLMVYALIRFRKLPSVEQFSESAFETAPDELQNRLMSRYLTHFSDLQKYAVDNGFAETGNENDDMPIVDRLRRLKGELPAHCSGSDGWLYLFKEFQALQDERAKEIISRTWKLVAIKTAASPWKIVDMIAVIYNSTVMVTRLARLYNRRISGQAAFRLVCRWFVNIYIAGEMGDVTQGAVEWASANDLISATYKPLAGFVGKIAEGGANAFLVYRLGRRAMIYFRPLVEVKR